MDIAEGQPLILLEGGGGGGSRAQLLHNVALSQPVYIVQLNLGRITNSA